MLIDHSTILILSPFPSKSETKTKSKLLHEYQSYLINIKHLNNKKTYLKDKDFKIFYFKLKSTKFRAYNNISIIYYVLQDSCKLKYNRGVGA